MFNTLRYARQLEAAGISREQAEVHIEIMADIVESNLATKQDIQSLQQDIQNLRQGIQSLETRVDSKLAMLDYRLTIKCGAMMSTIAALLLAAIKLT